MVEEIHQCSSPGDEVDDPIEWVLILILLLRKCGQCSNIACGWNKVLEALASTALDSSSRGRNQV